MGRPGAVITLEPAAQVELSAGPFERLADAQASMRTEIWKHCNPARCGTVPGALDPDFDFTDYAAFLLDFPAIVRLDAQGEAHLDTRTFGEIYAAKPMNDADVAHAMSMTWPDVRLKSYIEIRPADSMPIPYVIAYGALIKGIFYTPENLTKLRCTLGPVGGTAVATAKDELMKHGYSAEVYGHPTAKLCDMLIELGRKGLEPDEQGYIEPLAELVAARETLAERQLRAEGAK